MRNTFVFFVGMYTGLLIKSAISIWVFGHIEPALGGAAQNFSVSAALSILVVVLGAVGFVLLCRKISYAHVSLIILSGIISAGLVFAWPIIARPISSDIVNIIGFGIYCVGLGLVSALILARWSNRRTA